MAAVEKIGGCRATRDVSARECLPAMRCDLFKFSSLEIMKKQRSLCVGHAKGVAVHLRIHVTISYEDVLPPVIVVVDRIDAHTSLLAAIRAVSHSGLRSDLGEIAFAVVVIEHAGRRIVGYI